MEYITKKDLIDCSTPDEFCFSLCCMECKTVWKSTPIRFSKAGKKPENENGDGFRWRNEENVRQNDVW